jgi:hypothetical protein
MKFLLSVVVDRRDPSNKTYALFGSSGGRGRPATLNNFSLSLKYAVRSFSLS